MDEGLAVISCSAEAFHLRPGQGDLGCQAVAIAVPYLASNGLTAYLYQFIPGRADAYLGRGIDLYLSHPYHGQDAYLLGSEGGRPLDYHLTCLEVFSPWAYVLPLFHAPQEPYLITLHGLGILYLYYGIGSLGERRPGHYLGGLPPLYLLLRHLPCRYPLYYVQFYRLA